jgi:metallo-beta-lactamase class B
MYPFKKLLQTIPLVATLAMIGSTAFTQKVVQPPGTTRLDKGFSPFRIAGNLYYVGTYELACYLIATDKGLMLIRRN